jgi:hypothetical protein
MQVRLANETLCSQGPPSVAAILPPHPGIGRSSRAGDLAGHQRVSAPPLGGRVACRLCPFGVVATMSIGSGASVLWMLVCQISYAAAQRTLRILTFVMLNRRPRWQLSPAITEALGAA